MSTSSVFLVSVGGYRIIILIISKPETSSQPQGSAWNDFVSSADTTEPYEGDRMRWLRPQMWNGQRTHSGFWKRPQMEHCVGGDTFSRSPVLMDTSSNDSTTSRINFLSRRCLTSSAFSSRMGHAPAT